MKVPIRMIGIAASVFWIILIIFCVSALYSLKDIQLQFGQPRVTLTQDDEMLFTLPMTILNKGYYNLGHFNISTAILGNQNQTVATGSTSLPVISKGEAINFTHQMTVNLTDLLSTYQNLLFNDTELQINATASITAAEVIPIQVSSNFPVPWGAPLYDFTLGPPEFTVTPEPNSSVLCRVVVPISFENHAFFDLTGTMHLNMYNDTDAFITEGQVTIEAKQNSYYQGSLEFYFPANLATRNGHFELYFSTSIFSNGPLVFFYGV
jgi:hypothetical protein